MTGTIGDAAIGLRIRQGRGPELAAAERDFLLRRYLTPEPRLKLAKAMSVHAHGGMDVSDGFVGDLTKMLAVSGVSARVPIYRLPLSQAARAAIAVNPDLYKVAASGGDDYELLASVAPEFAPAFEAEAAPRRRAGHLRRRGCRGLWSAAFHRSRWRNGDVRPRLLQPFLKGSK